MIRLKNAAAVGILAFSLLLVLALPASAGRASKGQLVLVTAYTKVYHGVRTQIPLANSLFIRNTDRRATIKILSVDQYGPDGRLAARSLKKPLELAPLASACFTIPQGFSSGGKTGAISFLVSWRAARPVSPAHLECITIGSSGAQGISTVSSGIVLKEFK